MQTVHARCYFSAQRHVRSIKPFVHPLRLLSALRPPPPPPPPTPPPPPAFAWFAPTAITLMSSNVFH
jgi:hypothetical protein